MILTGREINRRLGSDIIIEPFRASQLNPNSYNLRLDNKLLVYNTMKPIDMAKQNETVEIEIPETGYTLLPGTLYLGKTLEYTETHSLIPMLEGRSSIGRLGICVHVTAGFGDVGFAGCWTLELSCVQPVIIYPGIEICQIYYHEPLGEITEYDNGKYQGSKDVEASKMWHEFKGGIYDR